MCGGNFACYNERQIDSKKEAREEKNQASKEAKKEKFEVKKRGVTGTIMGSISLLGICALLVSCASAEGEKSAVEPEFVLTYAENQAEDYPTTQGAYRFAELVEERTGGKILVQVNAGAALGDEQSVIEQLQFGGIDFTRASLSSVGEFIPKVNVLQMPYLYNSADHMWKVLESEIGDQFLHSFEGYGLVGLSWYDAGARNFYTSEKPIRTPEDMVGMRIRVQESELMSRMVELIGAEPVQMAFASVYSALETGKIDGAENNWPSYQSERHYEVAKYMTVDEHARVPEVQMIAESTWKKLSPEYQQIIRECAKESALYERKLWEERTKRSREIVEKAGCQVIELTQEEKAAFQEKMLPLYNEYCGEYMGLIDKIVEAGK